MKTLAVLVFILGLWFGFASCNQLCGGGSQCPPSSQCTLPAGGSLSNVSLYYCDDGLYPGCEDCSKNNATNGEICQIVGGASTGAVQGKCACQEALGFQQNPTVGFYSCENKNPGSCQCKPPFVCISEKCQCPAGSVYYIPPGGLETCVIVDSGTQCQNDSYCVNFPGSQCLFGICQCPQGFYLNFDTNPASCAPNPPPAPAFCLISGDPHMTTFDGLGFSHQERCDYIASRSIQGAPFQYEVHVRTGECGWPPNVFPAIACVKEVAVRYGSSGVLEFNMTGAWFNGTQITSFPFTGYPGVTVFNDNNIVGYYSAVLGPNGEIKVDFSPYTLVIYANPSFSDFVEGWCGDYNNDFLNDYGARNGSQLPVIPFARSWTVLPNLDPTLFRYPNSEICLSPNGFKRNVPAASPNRNIFLDPCNGNLTALAEAKQRCNVKVLAASIPTDLQQACIRASNRINLQYFSASCIFDYCNAPTIDFRSYFLKNLINLCKFIVSSTPISPQPTKTPSATSGTPPVATTTKTPGVVRTCPPCPQGAACDPTAAELVCKCLPPAQPVFVGSDFKCEIKNTAPVGCTSNEQCIRILGQGGVCDTTATPPKCTCGPNFFFDSTTKTCKPTTVTIPVVNPAVCYGTGDPHFMSFDGLWYDHQERCDYVLAKATTPIPFEVQIRTGECKIGAASSSFPSVSCTRAVAMKFGSERLVFELGVGVSKDGVNVTSFPYTFLSGQVIVTSSGPDSWQANYTTANIIVSYQIFFASVKVYPTYLNNTVGLCGNFNGMLTDDFTGQNGTLWSVPNPFARSWTVPAYPNAANLFNDANPEVCASPNGFKRVSGSIFEDPCQGNVTLLTRAFQACNFTDLLNSPVIDKDKCQQAFDFGYVTPMCIFDYCQSGVDLGELMANVTQQSIIGLCTLAQTLTVDATVPVATQTVTSTSSVGTTPAGGQPTPTSTQSQLSGSPTLTFMGVLALIASLVLVM